MHSACVSTGRPMVLRAWRCWWLPTAAVALTNRGACSLLFMALAPARWPPLWLVGCLCDQHYVVAMCFAATVALTTTTAYAFLTAFGVRMPVGAMPGR